MLGDIYRRTKQEYLGMDYFMPNEPFRSIIIVPTGEIHDSGFECMKFILTDGAKLVGVVGGGSDVININGIGGYGKDFRTAIATGMVPCVDWSIDCLPESGCLRLFSHKKCELSYKDFVGSSFEFVALEDEYAKTD